MFVVCWAFLLVGDNIVFQLFILTLLGYLSTIMSFKILILLFFSYFFDVF